jgi:hypothetical protein
MSAVPEELRVRCRAALLAGMRGVFKVCAPHSDGGLVLTPAQDKDEEYLRSLVVRFEQEKLHDLFKDAPAYVANANAKLLQVDKTAALLTVAAPVPVAPVAPVAPPPAAGAAAPGAVSPEEYWRVREQLAAKYLPHLRSAMAHLHRIKGVLPEKHAASCATVVEHSDKMAHILEGRELPDAAIARLESNCQKCLAAAKQLLGEARKLEAAAAAATPTATAQQPAPQPTQQPKQQQQLPAQQPTQPAALPASPQKPGPAPAAQPPGGPNNRGPPPPGLSKEAVRAALGAAPRERLTEIQANIHKRLRIEFVAENPFF